MNSIASILIASLLLQVSTDFRTAYAQVSKEKSLITHLIEEANQPDFHSEGDVFLLVKIGEVDYTVELQSGKIISQQKAQLAGGGICGDYAEVSLNLLDKDKHETSQGAGQILKLSKGKWKMIALSEGDYACEKLKGISKSVMTCLKVECY